MAERRNKFMVVSLIVVALLSGCDRGGSSSPAATLPRVGLAGLRKLVAEARQARQVLVLDFWATWCEPCVAMFPALHEGVAKLGPGVKLVSVTLDAPDSEAGAMAFLRTNHALEGALMLEPDTDVRLEAVRGISREWKNLVVPAILIYGQGGTLEAEFLGDSRVEPILIRVRELLQKPPAATQP